ncbi:uncharacterized protein [Nerophis lumbriciformis]|uniref:uncharacterized protein n=1 Tax=Nerophis lumbriciformis TaxID=546530 RepID=UPI003BA9CFD9
MQSVSPTPQPCCRQQEYAALPTSLPPLSDVITSATSARPIRNKVNNMLPKRSDPNTRPGILGDSSENRPRCTSTDSKSGSRTSTDSKTGSRTSTDSKAGFRTSTCFHDNDSPAACSAHAGRRAACSAHAGRRSACSVHAGRRAACSAHAGRRSTCSTHAGASSCFHGDVDSSCFHGDDDAYRFHGDVCSLLVSVIPLLPSCGVSSLAQDFFHTLR